MSTQEEVVQTMGSVMIDSHIKYTLLGKSFVLLRTSGKPWEKQLCPGYRSLRCQNVKIYEVRKRSPNHAVRHPLTLAVLYSTAPSHFTFQSPNFATQTKVTSLSTPLQIIL